MPNIRPITNLRNTNEKNIDKYYCLDIIKAILILTEKRLVHVNISKERESYGERFLIKFAWNPSWSHCINLQRITGVNGY